MLPDALRALVNTIQKKFNIPGIAIAVVHKGEAIVSEGVGYCEVDQQHLINEHTLFRIASLTKSFISTAIMQLVQQGKLNLEDKICDLLPELGRVNTEPAQRVTVKDLLLHRTGLLSYPSNLLAYWGFSEKEIGAQIFSVESVNIPGKNFQYHNGGYVVAGMLIESLTGMSWRDYVTNNIFLPLKLVDAYNSEKSLIDSRITVAFPHVLAQNGHRAPAFLDFGDCLGAAGGINASIYDMKRWLLFNLKHLSLPNLDNRALDTIHHGQIDTPISPKTNALEQAISPHGYSLGWYRFQYSNFSGIYHTGSVPGYTSLVAILPETDFGIVLLCNQMLMKHALQALMLSIFDIIFNTSKKTNWIDIASALSNEIKKTNHKILTFDHAVLHSVTGSYAHEVFGTLDIAQGHGNIFLIAGPGKRKFPLKLIDSEVYEFIFDMEDVKEFLFYPTRLFIDTEKHILKIFPRIDNRDGTITEQDPIFFYKDITS